MKPAMSRPRKRFLVSAFITAGGHFPTLPTAGTRTLSRRGSSGHIPLSDPPKDFEKSEAEPDLQEQKTRRPATSASDGANENRDGPFMT